MTPKDLRNQILEDLRNFPQGRMYPKGMTPKLFTFLLEMEQDGLVVLDKVNNIRRVRAVKRNSNPT